MNSDNCASNRVRQGPSEARCSCSNCRALSSRQSCFVSCHNRARSVNSRRNLPWASVSGAKLNGSSGMATGDWGLGTGEARLEGNGSVKRMNTSYLGECPAVTFLLKVDGTKSTAPQLLAGVFGQGFLVAFLSFFDGFSDRLGAFFTFLA